MSAFPRDRYATMNRREKTRLTWILKQQTSAGKCEEQLTRRYPRGWEYLLDDPTILSEIVRKMMSARAPSDMNLIASMIDEIEAAHCSCGAMDAQHRNKPLPAWWAYCELHQRCDALRGELSLAQFGRAGVMGLEAHA